jgi:hypothetical protein
LEDELHSPDQVGVFGSPEDLVARGLGYCVLVVGGPDTGRIASAASSAAICRRGIEIQANTDEAHRRKGLATVAAAALAADCLSLGLEPHWSTSRPESMALARRLGYTPDAIVDLLVRTA